MHVSAADVLANLQLHEPLRPQLPGGLVLPTAARLRRVPTPESPTRKVLRDLRSASGYDRLRIGADATMAALE